VTFRVGRPYRTRVRPEPGLVADRDGSDDVLVTLVLLVAGLVPVLGALLSHAAWGSEPSLGLALCVFSGLDRWRRSGSRIYKF
jgi:hypothetical protein